MAQSTITNGESGLNVRNALNSMFGELYGTGSPTRVLFASKLSGIHQNTSLTAGGGTDDTSVLQTALNGGNVTLYIDGPSLISAVLFNGTTHFPALQLYSNTTLVFLPGGGFFLKANSNVPMIGAGQSLVTGVSNIALIGLEGMAILNGNAANQVKENPTTWWPYGVIFQNFNGVYMENIEVRNAKTFSIVFTAGLISSGTNFVVKNCRSYWNENNDVTIPENRNKDGIHLWGTLDRGLIDGYYSNGNDDVMAHNTDEGVEGFNTHVNASFIFGPSSGGDLTNITWKNVYIDTTNGIRAFRFLTYNASGGTHVCDNIVMDTVTGAASLGTEWGEVDMGTYIVDKWAVTGATLNLGFDGAPLENLGVANISSGVSIGVSGPPDNKFGDYFLSQSFLNTVYVTSSGIDSLGEVGNPALPFLTLQAAVDKFSTDFPGETQAFIKVGAGAFADIAVPATINTISIMGAGFQLSTMGIITSSSPAFSVEDVGVQSILITSILRDSLAGDLTVSVYNARVATAIRNDGASGIPGTDGGIINIFGMTDAPEVTAKGGDGLAPDGDSGAGGTITISGPVVVTGNLSAAPGTPDGAGVVGADGVVNVSQGASAVTPDPGSTDTFLASTIAGVFHPGNPATHIADPIGGVVVDVQSRATIATILNALEAANLVLP